MVSIMVRYMMPGYPCLVMCLGVVTVASAVTAEMSVAVVRAMSVVMAVVTASRQ